MATLKILAHKDERFSIYAILRGFEFFELCSLRGNAIKLPDYKDASASTVIPAWMPETRAMDGNLLMPCRMI